MVPAGLRWIDIALLVGYAGALSLGQVLFKSASSAVAGPGGIALLGRLLASPSFVLAAAIYAALTVYWTWLLSRVPLSHAYPFVALCFVFVPLMAWARFGERVSGGYGVGLVLILAGLVVIGVSTPR